MRPHIPDALAAARRLLGADDAAWDAVQESLVCLWCGGVRPANVAGWLMRAVVHRSLHLRRCRRRRHEEGAAALRPERSRHEGPAEAAQGREMRRRLDAALACLPREQREVVVLREAEQLDYAAVAERLGVPVGTVRSRLARARAALHALLVTQGEDGPEEKLAPAGTPRGPAALSG